MNINRESKHLVEAVIRHIEDPLGLTSIEKEIILSDERTRYQLENACIPRIWGSKKIYGRYTSCYENNRTLSYITVYLSPIIHDVKQKHPRASIQEQASYVCLGIYRVLLHETAHLIYKLRGTPCSESREKIVETFTNAMSKSQDPFDYAPMYAFTEIIPGLLRAFNHSGDLPFDLENISEITHK